GGSLRARGTHEQHRHRQRVADTEKRAAHEVLWYQVGLVLVKPCILDWFFNNRGCPVHHFRAPHPPPPGVSILSPSPARTSKRVFAPRAFCRPAARSSVLRPGLPRLPPASPHGPIS